jgi:hypothetical protein
MKKLKLVLFSFLVGLIANATDGELAQFDKIEIVLVDGTKYEIPINNQSYIYSYVEGTGLAAQQLVRVKGDNCEYLFNRNEISKMRCMEIIAGIENVTVDEIEKLQFEDGKVRVHSSLQGENMAVYDIAGRMVIYTTIDEQSIIDLSYLPAGVYVVKVNDQSIKVAVK